MIPVASGVLPDVEEGGRRIDLARRCAPAWFEFMELKVGKGCDTSLHAAIEILGYGLLYLFSRRNRDALGYDETNILLAASRIDLTVLAPSESYRPGSLAIFERHMQQGLEQLTEGEDGLDQLGFQFQQFPPAKEVDESSPCAAMDRRVAIYP